MTTPADIEQAGAIDRLQRRVDTLEGLLNRILRNGGEDLLSQHGGQRLAQGKIQARGDAGGFFIRTPNDTSTVRWLLVEGQDFDPNVLPSNLIYSTVEETSNDGSGNVISDFFLKVAAGTTIYTELDLNANSGVSATASITSVYGGSSMALAVTPTDVTANGVSLLGATVITPTVITPWSYRSLGIDLAALGIGAPASAAWPTANQAMYVPFTIDETVTVKKMFWKNGATVSGNVDIGIYNEAGTRKVNMGSTAQATINATQIVDIADTSLAAGRYYMALVADNTTATFASVTATQRLGYLTQTTAFALPATATFATPATAVIPYFGLTLETLV